MGFSSARNLGRDISAGFSPPRRMPISEAVKKFMRVPKGAGNSVPWDPELTPYIIEPMNCLASREYDAVIFVGPARTGKTIGLIDGWIVYTIVCDPSDMLVVQMTEDKAREHSKKRLDRTFRSSAAVKKRMSPRRNDNNVHDKTFRDGSFLKIGWPSVNIMSSSDYRFVALTDYLDNNHDLVIGVFDKLEERVVGKNGIIVEPHPVLRNGAIARDLAAEIRTRWSEWSVSPEVTGQFTRPMLERLMLRTWLRDGEVFAQMVSGRINSLTPSAGVHFWLEALEPDFIPMTSDESNRLNQGVFVDDWGRPEKYLVYKSRPVSGRQMETKEVDAERMLHLKFVRRLHQMRGTSLLSGVLIRLSALKEYEDSELTAARIAAALGMYIRKGDGQSYESDGNGSKENERELTIQPGIIYDDLKPGEEIGMVKSDRPNPNLETFRNGQLRAVAAGSRLSFSSTARNYNGTYSAQRQELVESTDGYLILQDWFIGAVTRPMYRAWLKQAVASGVIRLPRGLDRSSLYTAVYSGPVMPWIDPVKEAEAWKIQIRGGAATESDWVRAGGRNPVIMPENSFMMIHKPFGFTGGDAEDMRTYADLLDKVEAVLLPAYAQKTGKTTDEIAAMLADETWMSGAECLAQGFADQVTPAVKAMACIQSKRTEEFKKMPESIRNMITPPRNSAPRVQDDEPAASRTPVQAAAPVVDENSIRAQVLAEQKARANGINDLFAMFGGR